MEAGSRLILEHWMFCFSGQNPLHVLGQYGKENAAAIFELFMECMPNYPVDQLDSNGNTGEVISCNLRQTLSPENASFGFKLVFCFCLQFFFWVISLVMEDFAVPLFVPGLLLVLSIKKAFPYSMHLLPPNSFCLSCLVSWYAYVFILIKLSIHSKIIFCSQFCICTSYCQMLSNFFYALIDCLLIIYRYAE